MRFLENLSPLARRLLVIAVHVFLWGVAFVGAFILRFEGAFPSEHRAAAAIGLAVLVVLRVLAFWRAGLFHGMLRYAGVPEAKAIVQATGAASLAYAVGSIFFRQMAIPRSIYFGEFILAVLATSGLRLAVRVHRETSRATAPANQRRVLLCGGGDAGEMFLRDLARSWTAPMVVVGILDDDAAKHGSYVRGVRVLGPIDQSTLRTAAQVHDATLVVLAMPTASGERTREIIGHCHDLSLEVKTVPSLQQIAAGEVRVSMLRDVVIDDLLRRDSIRLDDRSMANMLRGKRVLVTGGAGSIGSELARQAARHQLASLALLDHNENGLFFLERELRASFPKLRLTPFIADIKDAHRIREVLATFQPHVILHAAAHKHVPLMEANPAEAVKNNIFGTRVVADLASAFGVETFVLISTDKAVNPTSVMGTSKRIAEMYVQSLSQSSRTRYACVRFGNVLGSAGSVVQIFQKQIEAGGPVTITDPEMRRYFMTIPEATQLVLQAGAIAKGGEIFLLDMGEPVRIIDLAEDMIRMSGLQPHVDIPIVFTGLRPGEKISEELFHRDEGYDLTAHPKIFVGQIAVSEPDKMREAFEVLRRAVDQDGAEIVAALSAIVPEATLRRERPTTEEADRVVSDLAKFDTLAAIR